MSSAIESTPAPRIAIDCATIATALAIIVVLSYWRLESTQYAIDFSAALAGIRPVLGATLLAALKIWSVWAMLTALGAGILRRLDAEIDFFDAILGGASGAWVAAYVLGESLGPIGLFRAPVIWLLMIACAVWIFIRPARGPISRFTIGQALALLAFGLLLVGLLPLELGSPAAPYMDVMSYPASVQRIMSFGRYLPFDNDPYGCWGPQAQTPGLELFLAMLGMSSRVSLGLLAHSAAMVPMAALIIFATYRLGAATLGNTAGGIAALMLFFTNTFRRMVGVRGTAVDLALVAVGLAFVLDRKSRRVTFALGCLILGTAVASHAIEGGLAIGVAALTLLLRDIGNPRVLILRSISFFGSVLVAAPDFAISTHTIIVYPILPMLQVAGIVAIVIASRALPQSDENLGASEPSDSEVGWMDSALIVIFGLAIIYTNATNPDSIFAQIFHQFPMLSIFAALGMIALGALRGNYRGGILGSPIAIALLMTIIIEAVAQKLGAIPGSDAFHAGIADLHYKLDEYWTPFLMVFPAAFPFAIICNTGRRTFVIIAVLAILLYPWDTRPNANYDYEEHSIAENWSVDLGIAARGYWGSTPDPRWTMGPEELDLVNVLNQERREGRITIKTHILHLAQDVIVWHQFNRFSVFTGIDDDPIVYDIPGSDIGWLAGGRVRQMAALSDAFAKQPPYVLAQVMPPPAIQFPPQGYDLIFSRSQLQLYRRHDLAASK